jgi:streptomycin 6-kinase
MPGVDVASRLRACKRTWHLEGGSRLDGGFRSDVFGCTTAAGAEVVVKLTVTQEQARAEAAALAMWEHTRATVRIIDVDLGAARAAAMRLCATARQTVVLHGDFLDKNLLRNGARYVAIDPIPRVGDPCADVGFFAAGHWPATGILPRADAIAEQMGLDRHRAQRWAAVWTVLQTCHAWREDQSDLEACVASSEFEQLLRARR